VPRPGEIMRDTDRAEQPSPDTQVSGPARGITRRNSWDFVSLTQHRPAWDIVVWLLSIVGLVMSVSGVVVGWRRLRR